MCSESQIAVQVSNLSKVYKIFDSPGKRFCYHLLKRDSMGTDFHALQNVSFTIKKGESFGIVGRNGSGKSTLLQILAGILKPTRGEVKVNGRIAALLELGSGFNPENTGYENIYMNAAILGVGKDEIKKKIDEIIAFADIGDFINQPVKTYSSGMYIRLAFAVAINVDADVILIDEALAVGDIFFRQKCYAKLNEMKEAGKTIILVSHGMNEVEQFCDRALLLSHGKTMMLDSSRDVVKMYYVLEQEEEIQKKANGAGIGESLQELVTGKCNYNINSVEIQGWERKDDIFYDLSQSVEISSEKTTFLRVGLFDEDGFSKRVFHQGEMACFYYEVLVKKDIQVPLVGIVIRDQRNIIIHGKDSLQLYMDLPDNVEAGTVLYIVQYVKLDLAVGEYTFEVGMADISRKDYEMRGERHQEEVNATMERLSVRSNVGNFAVHSKTVGEPMRLMFHGCADLYGDIKMVMRKEKI